MNKIIYVFLLLLIASCSSEQDQELTFVCDFENILNEGQELKLSDLIRKHEESTTNEIVIVTTPDWGDQKDILFYAVNFGEIHGIGKKDKDNGIVIVFSKHMRQTRISTGYGTEQVLKDELAKKIIDSLMIPNFKEGQYFEGIFEGTKAVVEFLERPGHEIK